MQQEKLTTVGEEEDDEPRLKYQRLGASVYEVLEKAAASCLCVSEKILALGTHDGNVHILDVGGNEVRAKFDGVCIGLLESEVPPRPTAKEAFCRR